MHKFWYHSPVRFLKNKEDFEDMTNPQNTQFYGHVGNPYPLEHASYHRFLIPNYQNEVDSDNLSLWIVGNSETQIPCEFGIADSKLFRISFICFEFLTGHFEIRKDNGEVIYYSNCIQFLDSTDLVGRKFVRVATKHTYNKNLFSFANSQYDWMITNLPAYCHGEFDIDEDVKTDKDGDSGSTVPLSAWQEEIVQYEVLSKGDNNILSFLAVHSANEEFYIDGTKRTRKEKPEIGEFSSSIKIKFSNQKDENGLNITLDEDEIFGDVFRQALGNGEKTMIYIHDTNYAIPTK